MKTFVSLIQSAALLLLAAGFSPAFADSGIAYALISDGTLATVSAQYSLNPSGGAVTATRNGTGSYLVSFPNSGIGTGWSVEATAYGGSADYCNITGWSAGGATVQCYGPSGAVADSPFTVLAVSTTNDKDIAFALADQDTNPSYTPTANNSFNPSGAIGVTRAGPGVYTVGFNGLNASGGTVQVTAYNSNASCYSAGWTGTGTFNSFVDCTDPSGNPVDSEFVIDVVPAGVTPTGIAFSWANNQSEATYTPEAEYTYNPTGSAVSIARSSAGQYVVTFAGLNTAQVMGGNVRATSYTSAARCSVASWGPGTGDTLNVSVDCYNLTGGAADAEYQILVLPPMGYAYALINDGVAATVSPAYSVNPGGVTPTATHNSTGTYTVNFPNSGIDAGWSVQAVAYGGTAAYCKVQSWMAGSINVLCFDSGGTAADSQFTVQAISNTNGESIGFALADQPTAATYTPNTAFAYNPSGTITATRTAAGTYTVLFNGLNGAGGTVQVTAYGSDNTSCYSNGWNGSSISAGVICEDPTGTPIDSEFTIAVIPAGATPPGIGFALADQATTAGYTPNSTYSYNPGGAVSVTRTATGEYTLTFSGLNSWVVNGGNVSATAYETTNRCVVGSWDTSTANVLVNVSCYTLAGTLADSEYEVLVFAPLVGSPAAVTANAGTPQSAVVTTAFGAALSAQVTDANNNPVSGVTVTFTAPDSGASGTFPGSALTATSVTNSAGLATAPAFTANSITGTYTVAASVLGVATPASFALTNTALTSVTLNTSPQGLLVSLDGESFVVAPFTAQLVAGTEHTITTETPQTGGAGIQYAWTNWSDSGAISHTITVPATAASYTATFQTQYQLTISVSPAGGGAVTPVSGLFYNSGAVVPIVATATPGYSFNGWTGAVASPSSASTTVTMATPESVTANFVPFTSITIQTIPSGLQFSLDGGSPQTAPQTLSLSEGTHTITVATTQAGSAGTQYVFSAWSDSGAASHTIAVGSSPATYIATFQTQYQLSIAASPGAGGTVAPASGTYYNAATVVPISATANSGYSFSSWSGPVANPTAASSTVTMSGPETVTANFSSLTGVTIQTNPAGLQFSVDGGPSQIAPQTLNLSPGTHTLVVATTQAGAAGTQYVFSTWSDGGAATHNIVVSSSPATYTAAFQTQYQLTISASPAAGGTVTPASGGYYNAATVVPVSATTNPGYSFNGWTGAVAHANTASTTVTMSAPENITANFLPLTSITIQTIPAGLQFSVDGGAPQTAPQTLSLSQTTHTIAVVPTQTGPSGTLPGTQFVFTGWSDLGAASHTIVVGSSAATYTATFKTQYQLTISGSPAAGGSVTPASGTFYDAGTLVPIGATANGGYTFNNWSGTVANATSASTTVTMSAPETVTANFSSLNGITIQTNPPGLQFSVDGGTPQTAPQTLSLSLGTHTIAVAPTQPGATGTQYVFVAWSDGGTASHSITVTSSAATYTASFAVQYLLTSTVSPSGGGTVIANPAATGYTPGAIVQLTATPNVGYQFSGWSGDLGGSTNPQFITMNAPHSVTANFSAVAPTCTLALSEGTASLPATGTSTVETCPNGSGQPNCGVTPEVPASFAVTPSGACGAWTATSSNPAILQITPGSASGNGAGAVGFTLLNNTHTVAQSYTIAVTSGTVSATYTVTEAGSGDNEVYRQVYALYEQLLGRDPDPTGFAFWTGEGGTALGQMADSFLTSPESFNSDFAVMAVYQAATGAAPSYAQFTAAVTAIRAGTQTVPGLFNSLINGSYSATTLYQNLLNRAPTATEISDANGAGLASWLETLIGYPSSTTPVGATNNEFQSTGTYHTTLAADHSNALYVQMLYYVILSRNPDLSGLAFWEGVANSGGPGILFQGNAGLSTRIQILGPGTPNQGFIGSTEFQGLFAN
ncbi:MAG TPA: DUF4214 domain-containing protein [Bryobacteraceae bacterium]|nr:DUF4214 domain-containing protein [Bryobacteraceae bacterium]